jgi:hypothetical protein
MKTKTKTIDISHIERQDARVTREMALQSFCYQTLQNIQTYATSSTQMTVWHKAPTHPSHPKPYGDRCYSGGTWHPSRLLLRSIERRKPLFATFRKGRRTLLYLDSYSEPSRQAVKGSIHRMVLFSEDTRTPERHHRGRREISSGTRSLNISTLPRRL